MPRAGHAGKHDERVARNIDIDVLEVVFSRASYAPEAALAFRGLIDGQGVHALRRKEVPHPNPTRLRWQLRREYIDVHDFRRFGEEIRRLRH